jgi:hypothetical protein
MPQKRKQRPAPPRVAFGRPRRKWDHIVEVSARETCVSPTPRTWTLLEGRAHRAAVLAHSGAPVLLWLWGDGRWHFLPGPLSSDTLLPGDGDGAFIALRAEGPAQIRGRLLQQQVEPVEWPSLDPPAQRERCTHRATNGINGSECDVEFRTGRRLCSEIHFVVQPGSIWETQDGRQALEAELRRSQAWWARYCIYLAFRPVTLPAEERNKLQRECLLIDQNFPRDNNDATASFHALTYWLYGACRRAARARRVVMFFDRCLSWRAGQQGNQGHNLTDLVGTSRATPGSATIIGRDAIIVHKVELTSRHIVTHELIHLLGRPLSDPFQQSQTTWNHTSACQESMSTAPARGLAPFSFEDSRRLDVAEYPEIAASGHLKRC